MEMGEGKMRFVPAAVSPLLSTLILIRYAVPRNGVLYSLGLAVTLQ